MIVEEGDHDTLMARQGAYWRLHEAQAKGAQPLPASAASREEDAS